MFTPPGGHTGHSGHTSHSGHTGYSGHASPAAGHHHPGGESAGYYAGREADDRDPAGYLPIDRRRMRATVTSHQRLVQLSALLIVLAVFIAVIIYL